MSSLAPIKNWKPKHDQVIILHLSGLMSTEIADRVDYSVMRVRQILADPHAQELIAQAQKALRMKMMETIGDRMLGLAETGSRRLEETIDERFEPGSRAKHHQDKMSLEVLKGTGFLKKLTDREEEDVSRFTPKQLDKLTAALEKANEVAELVGTPITPHEEIASSSSDTTSNDR